MDSDEDDVPEARISSVSFGILDEDDVQRLSVCRITNKKIYDAYSIVPNSDSVNSALLGPVVRKMLCKTCYQPVETCNGHFGHIELAHPVFNPEFLNVCEKLLRLVCFFCYRLVVEYERVGVDDLSGKARFKAICDYYKGRKNPKCTHEGCQKPLPNVSKNNNFGFSVRWTAAFEDEEDLRHVREAFTAREALQMFRNIEPQQMEELGFSSKHSKPEAYIISSLLVPPNSMRHGIVLNEGSKAKNETDLTKALGEIIKADEVLREAEDGSAAYHDALEILQFRVGTYIDNEQRGQAQMKQHSGALMRSVVSGIKGTEGKQGRVRFK